MKTFSIPKKFQIMGQTIEVIWDGEPFLEKDGHVAFSSYRKNQIQMRPLSSHPRNPEQLGHDFFHELIHFILYYAGAAYQHGKHDFMHQDEGFVDLVGGLLHQAMTTMEYEGSDYSIIERKK